MHREHGALRVHQAANAAKGRETVEENCMDRRSFLTKATIGGVGAAAAAFAAPRFDPIRAMSEAAEPTHSGTANTYDTAGLLPHPWGWPAGLKCRLGQRRNLNVSRQITQGVSS